MRCPHCHADLKYRERSNRTCSRCKKAFALEPKENPFQLHDLAFRKVVEQLSQGGRWSYTVDQLRHRAGRKVAAAQVPSCAGAFGCLIPSVVIGIFVGIFVTNVAQTNQVPAVVGVIMGVLVVLLGIAITAYRMTLPFKFALPMNTQKFTDTILNRWWSRYREQPPGLIDQAVLNQVQMDAARPDPHQVRAVVACPEPDVLTCLRANRAPERLNIQLIPTREPFTPTEQATVERLRRAPGLPLVLLHDASPAGCLLAENIVQWLGLQPGHTIVDAGLHPEEAMREKMMRLGTSPPKQTLRLLQKRVSASGAPPAPGQHPRPLSQKEFDWLKKGYYTPILAATPVGLVKKVVNALSQAAPGRDREQTPDPEQQAQQEARDVGFMTWPA
ncbi:MAG: hypothetical protein HC884_13810 [Chloroflexaceae bacterium]|nr:hypothetical protein [Chloroflexaceae bacterium]